MRAGVSASNRAVPNDTGGWGGSGGSGMAAMSTVAVAVPWNCSPGTAGTRSTVTTALLTSGAPASLAPTT